MDLSTGRANGVLRYLQVKHKIPFSRMFTTGYSDTRPLKAGKNAAAMTANEHEREILLARAGEDEGTVP